MDATVSRVEVGKSRSFGLLGLVSARAILTITCIILAIASGYRWLGEGRDYAVYWQYYNNIPAFFDVRNNRFEIGYQLVAWFFRLVLNVEYEVFATILAGVALGIKFYLFKRYLRRPFTATLLYVATFYPLHEYTQIRTALGVSLALLGIHLWLERRWLTAIVSFALAISFHYSSPALIVAFFAGAFFTTRIRIATVAALAAIVVLRTDVIAIFASYASALNPVVQDYAYGSDFYYAQNIFSLQNVVLAFIVIYSFGSTVFSASQYHQRFTIILLAALAAIPVFYDAPVLAARMRDILMVPAIFLVCRSPLKQRDLPMVGAMALLALWQLRSALQDGLIVF